MAKIKRVYGTLTYLPEKKLLDHLASKLYKLAHADFFSYIALFGAVLTGYSMYRIDRSLNFLHLANFGIFLHWFGDSLDGRVAGLRDQSRPKYGHYFDHIIDSISLVLIFTGIALSPISTASIWIACLVMTLLIFNHAYLKASVTKVFNMSVAAIGGTEARIIFIIANLTILITGNPMFNVFGSKSLLDILGIVVLALLIIGFFGSVSSTLWGKNKITEDN